MVLSTADQDFMVQKPPEGKGRRGHWRPPPPARLAASLCVHSGKGWPAEGRGCTPGRDGQLLLYISNQDPEPGCTLPWPTGLGGDRRLQGLTRQEADVPRRGTVRSVSGKGSRPEPGLKLRHQDGSVA